MDIKIKTDASRMNPSSAQPHRACTEFPYEGLSFAPGNFSARIDDDTFLITP